MIYAEPIIMYEVHCPQCGSQIILYREDLDEAVICEQCTKEFQVSPPVEEIGELIYDRTG
ncbi:MAG: hypothetical protein KJP19_07955 [Deltaproteobacteria bacterium]|nr:hypothetical protein [Deltaproteobacteria bacterium]